MLSTETRIYRSRDDKVRKNSAVVAMRSPIQVSRAILFEEGDPPPFFDLQGGMKELLDSPPAFRLHARPI